MMEAASTSEVLVNFYYTTWRYNPEDRHLQVAGYFGNCNELSGPIKDGNLLTS
jgi:hypothetical protein